MLTGLFHAHSGLRYLILLVGVIAVVYYLIAWRSARPVNRADRILFSSFTGLLDLQILLGLGMVFSGIFYPALVGHLVMMLGAAVLVHVLGVRSKKTDDARKAQLLRLVAIVGAFVLIIAGIQSIGRGILQSNAPTLEVVTGE